MGHPRTSPFGECRHCFKQGLEAVELYPPQCAVRKTYHVFFRGDMMENGRHLDNDFILTEKVGTDIISVVVVDKRAYNTLLQNIISVAHLSFLQKKISFFIVYAFMMVDKQIQVVGSHGRVLIYQTYFLWIHGLFISSPILFTGQWYSLLKI